MTPEELADAFMEWFRQEGLDGRLTRDEIEILALAFGAGVRWAVTR